MRGLEAHSHQALIPLYGCAFLEGEPRLEPLRALLFGVTIAAPVGPIALLLVHIGLNHRLPAALLAALGVAAADFTYALVALTVGAALATALSAHAHALQGFSSTLLIALGWWLARKAMRASAGAGPPQTRMPGMARLYLLTLANPLTIVLFVGFAGQLHATRPVEIAVDAAMLFAGSLAVQAAYAACGAALQRWLTDARAVRTLNVASGVAIALFGLYGLARTLT
jgi:threonine/homoserine/homoserine lactone efflux protein